MNPGIVQAVTKLAEGIHYLHTKDFHPDRLSGNMLALFQKFKTSYDSKDIPGLSSVITV